MDPIISAPKGDLPALCLRANSGSSWAALVIAMHLKPVDFTELVRLIGVPKSGKHRERAFDAAADAWAMFCDAKDQGEI